MRNKATYCQHPKRHLLDSYFAGTPGNRLRQFIDNIPLSSTADAVTQMLKNNSISTIVRTYFSCCEVTTLACVEAHLLLGWFCLLK